MVFFQQYMGETKTVNSTLNQKGRQKCICFLLVYKAQSLLVKTHVNGLKWLAALLIILLRDLTVDPWFVCFVCGLFGNRDTWLTVFEHGITILYECKHRE